MFRYCIRARKAGPQGAGPQRDPARPGLGRLASAALLWLVLALASTLAQAEDRGSGNQDPGSSAQDPATKAERRIEPSPCLDVWDPVCGADGRTYSNSCSAEQAGTSVACRDVCPCADPDPGPEPIPKLLIEPRQVVVLDRAGDSYQLRARWQGDEEPAKNLVWESSDPAQVVVDGGYVRALTDDAYAIVTVRSPLDIVHEPAYASVMVAQLQPGLVQLSASLVRSIDVVSLGPEESAVPFPITVVVDLTKATAGLRSGDVAVFDDQVSIDVFSAIVDEKKSVVTLRGDVPGLDQVFENLRVELDSRAMQRVAEVMIRAEEAKLKVEKAAGCAFQLVPEIGGESLVYVDLQDGKLIQAAFLLDAFLGLTVPSVSVDARVNCHFDSPLVPIGVPVPLLAATIGVFGYAAIGGDLVFDLTDGFGTDTPSLSVDTIATGGFEYRDGKVVFPTEFEDPSTEYDPKSTFFGPSEVDVSVDLSAYVEAGLRMHVFVGPWPVPAFSVVDVNAAVLRFTMGRHFSLPLQAVWGPEHPDYLGPTVADYFDGHFWALKNIGTGDRINRILEVFGVGGLTYEAPGWELFHVDHHHPRPTLSTTTGQVFVGGGEGYPPSLGIATELSQWIHPFLSNPIERTEVWSRSLPGGDFHPMTVGGSLNYTPTSDDVGHWQLRSMAFNRTFGPFTDRFPSQSNIVDLEIVAAPGVRLAPTAIALAAPVTQLDELIFTATNPTQSPVTYDLRLSPAASPLLSLDAEGAFTLEPGASRYHGIRLSCGTEAGSGEGPWLVTSTAGQGQEYQHGVSWSCALLEIDPPSLAFSMEVGESETKTVELRSLLSGPLDWVVANGGAPALSISPTSGRLETATEIDTVTITASCGSAGRTETSIVFASFEDPNDPWLTQNLPVTVACADDGGDTWGDPHLVTFDEVSYDFQAKGELVLTRGAAGNFEIQTRQEPRGSTAVTLNTAVAARVGHQRVGFYVDPPVGGGALMVDGEAVSLAPGASLTLASGGRIERGEGGAVYWLRWPSSAAYARITRGRTGTDGYFNVFVRPDPVHGALTGLLGDDDDDGSNDFRLRNGVALPSPPSFEQLYDCSVGDCFAYDDPHGWLVRSESLFDYSPGESTEDFAPAPGELYPPGPISLDDFPADEVDWALSVCLGAGLVEPHLVDACALDILVTGDIEMGLSATDVQASAGQAPVPGFECSSEHRPGWCRHLQDGLHGECNVGEWATLGEPTGSVRITFEQLEAVETIALFDRACSEQVKSGEIRFGDGSPKVTFGELPDDGETAVEIVLDTPRLVPWIEIHLLTTYLPGVTNPGLGEVVINGGTITAP